MQESLAAQLQPALLEDGRALYSNHLSRRLDLDRKGNWCGHNPVSPRFFEKPESHKQRPKVIDWAMDAWRRFYSSPSSCFSELRLTRYSGRKQRSESREALASISQVLLHYTELASLRVGVPHITDGFRSLTVKFLADKAGIGLKRALRALALLKRAGYIRLIERFDLKEQGDNLQFIGLAAVKCITPAFFKACGINLQWLSAQRRLARKRINKHANRHMQSFQETRAPVIDIKSLVGVQANSRAHVALMKKLLMSDDAKKSDNQEKARLRRFSLMRSQE